MTIELSVVGTAAAALLAAAVVALISTPVVRSLAFRVGAVDVPKDGRRMHNQMCIRDSPLHQGAADFYRAEGLIES